MTNPSIWVLLQTEETLELIAELDEKTIDRLATRFFDEMQDDNDPSAPKNVEQVKDMIREVIDSDEKTGYFSTYELRLQELNVLVEGDVKLLEDLAFEVKRGATVFEAANRIVMGCDMCYALAPIGYFTKKIEFPEDDSVIWSSQSAEWHERTLS